MTVGLYWEFDEHCWQCIICGYQGYEQVSRSRNKVEIVAARIWDEILDSLDKEENRQTAHHY